MDTLCKKTKKKKKNHMLERSLFSWRWKPVSKALKAQAFVWCVEARQTSSVWKCNSVKG